MLCRRRPVSVYPDGNYTNCNLDSPLQWAEHLDVARRVNPTRCRIGQRKVRIRRKLSFSAQPSNDG
jgi:hypothetical protein